MKDYKTDIFKNTLDKWRSTIPDEPQIPGQCTKVMAKTVKIQEKRIPNAKTVTK